jgi:serine protease AprX
VDQIANLVNTKQGSIKRQMKRIPSLAVEIPYSALEELAVSRRVKRIWHDAKVQALLDIAVPTVGGKYARENGLTGQNTVAAVIDTGIYPHQDLITPENRIIGWVDLLDKKESPYDDNGHGTHVAGIIAGNGYSSRGRYRGMAPEAHLVGVKALDGDGSGNVSDIIAGIEWIIENRLVYNIQAINLSLGAIAQDAAGQDPLCRATSAAWR